MNNEEFHHQLRNHLTVIQGNLDLLKQTEISDESQNFIATAKAEIKEILDLMESN
jgi:hypothetical protein